MGIARSTYYHEPKSPADDTTLVEAMHAIKDEFEAYGCRIASIRHSLGFQADYSRDVLFSFRTFSNFDLD